MAKSSSLSMPTGEYLAFLGQEHRVELTQHHLRGGGGVNTKSQETMLQLLFFYQQHIQHKHLLKRSHPMSSSNVWEGYDGAV